MGAPYDLYSISDLEREELEQYSFYIFLNQYDLTDSSRKRIETICKTKGKTVLWLYAPDYAANGENSAARISDITGIRVSEVPESPGKMLWNGVPAAETIAPHFVIRDENAVVKARFEDGSAAAAEKDLHGCRSIYAALYRLPSDFLRTLLRESGVFLYSENPRVYTYANTAFVGVYNATEEDCVIRVKKDGIYTDYVSGDTFRTEEGILRLPKREIRAYLLVPQETGDGL
jgi:hypothetical protein